MSNKKEHFQITPEVMAKVYAMATAAAHMDEANLIMLEAKIAIMNNPRTSNADAFVKVLNNIDDAMSMIGLARPFIQAAIGNIPNEALHAQDVCPCPNCWRARYGGTPGPLTGHHVVFDARNPK